MKTTMRLLMALLPGIVLLACDSTTDAGNPSMDTKTGTQGTSELGPLECEVEADGSCPEGCVVHTVSPFDEAKGCVDTENTETLCTSAEGGGGAVTCGVFLETGVLYVYYAGPGWNAFHGWGPCTEEEYLTISDAHRCE